MVSHTHNGGRSTIALSATPGVPGPQLGIAQYDTFGFQLLHAPQDVVTFNSRLKRGVGGVDTTNSRGVWRNDGVATELLIREFNSEVPGIVSAKFLVPSGGECIERSDGECFGSLVSGYGDVTAQDALAIWRLGGTGDDVLVARRNIGEPAGVSGGLFGGFSDLRINSAGAMSYVGELQLAGDVTTDNNRGLWLFAGESSRLVATPPAPEAPTLPGTVFETLDVPLLNDAGQLLFGGGLKSGVGGVTAGTAKGVWIAGGQSAE